MDFNVETATKAELLYMYKNSQQISMQTGLIGHLRADMGSSGKEFFSTWNGFRNDLNTNDFSKEFDDVINSLRFSGMLKSREDMSRYCHEHSNAGFDGNYTTEYGFRVSTEKHAYLIRLIPIKGDYNLYCYCYKKEWLDRHIQNTEKGISFINPNYKELFRIKDGDKIRIEYRNGEKRDFPCRYIDECHTEVGNTLYHICEFAEKMEKAGSKISPLNDEHSIVPPIKNKDRGDAR